MNKKIILFMSILTMVLFSSQVFSAKDDMQANNITINFPTDKTYDTSTGGLTQLNATIRWNSNTKNITNVSFIFTSGSLRYVFTNITMNGTGGAIAGATKGDFTYNITASQLTANTQYSVRVEIRNSTELGNDGAVNSSAITFTLDSLYPAISLNRPHNRESISISEGSIDLEYTPSDTNLGNVTLYIDGIKNKTSTSGTTSPNVTSGSVNKFSIPYGVNDDSVNWIVEVTDLAGLKTNSSTWTYSIIVYGGEVTTSYPTGGEQPSQGQPVVVGGSSEFSQKAANWIVKYIWLIAIVIVVIGFIIYQSRKK